MKLETATLAGGCFWCLEAVYEQINGVHKVVSGYAGGSVPDPSYELVCTGLTGHAEVVQITFDSNVVSFEGLLKNLQQADVTLLRRSDHVLAG